MLKKIMFLALIITSYTQAMLHRPAPKRSPYRPQTHNRSRFFSTSSSYDIATLNTRIYDPSRTVSPAIAKIQQYFQIKFEQSSRQLCEEICDKVKITKSQLQTGVERAQYIIDHKPDGTHVLLSFQHRKMIEHVLAQLDPEFKDVIVVSSRTVANEKGEEPYGFAQNNLMGVNPLIISKEIEPIYKSVVAHEAGHLKGKDSILEYVLRSYKIDKDLMRRVDHFTEMRADVYSYTRGQEWPSYGIDRILFISYGQNLTEDSNTHPSPSARRKAAELVEAMFKDVLSKGE